MDRNSFIFVVSHYICKSREQRRWVIPAITYLLKKGFISENFTDEDYDTMQAHLNRLCPLKEKRDRKEYQREYRKNHPDRGEQWASKHPRYANEYRKAHLSKGALYSQKYRAKQRYLSGKISLTECRKILDSS